MTDVALPEHDLVRCWTHTNLLGRRVLFEFEGRDGDFWLTLDSPYVEECLGHVFLARVGEHLFELRETRGPSSPPTHRVGEPAP